MLQIKLADRKACGPDDPMGRNWIGYKPPAPPEESFARDGVSGTWAPADLEVQFADIRHHDIKPIVEIYGFERSLTGASRSESHSQS